CQQCNTLPYTF
nr:immunoglobulin light chain junction region [Mus musculus]NSL97184.1 immunoglobulin light chain junction region [Mus musculus]NSL97253.1 immunoglobulin light chain junction region [Mus musculus]NSL97311.1 immunoglobulin light chain junction region [Mus musculus]NSL97379.1 immunoglobulin light chain junction region [Mus musculus]